MILEGGKGDHLFLEWEGERKVDSKENVNWYDEAAPVSAKPSSDN